MQNETCSCRCPKEHAEIWLSPPCDSESSDGRLWAPDNPFDPCPECGAEAVRFVRADLAASGKPCDPADPCPTAHDLATERDTLDGLLSEAKARLAAAQAEIARLREALLDATAHLVGAASAYRKHACRSRSVGRGCADPFFTTRIVDFDAAAARAQAALAELATKEI